MKRLLTPENLKNKRYKTLAIEGEWLSAIGEPQLTGSMLIFGKTKNGKTTFSLQFAKYLSKFGRVYYNSFEEGTDLSFRMAVERAGINLKDKVLFPDNGECFEELYERLSKPKSPKFVFIDSVQFMDLKVHEYKQLIKEFPSKLFIFVSHVKNGEPQGATANKIWRDAKVYFNVEGYRAFPVSRYGGGQFIDICSELAEVYHALQDVQQRKKFIENTSQYAM